MTRYKHHALVLDWDYFFPLRPEWEWSHWEDSAMIEGAVWTARAFNFFLMQKALPQSLGWRGFWNRFKFADGAKLYYADSNAMAYSALLADLGSKLSSTDIWLFDQHHDCYAAGAEALYEGKVTCENWMIQLGLPHDGNNLHVLYPDHDTAPMEAVPVPYFPNLDQRLDNELPPGYLPKTFDVVFVCRSGAWVPPWMDQEFFDLIDDCPVRGGKVNTDGVKPRECSLAQAKEAADKFREGGLHLTQ